MTMAVESGNPDILLDEVRFLPSEERDPWIAGYASLTQDYDYLELIEDNHIRDLAVGVISSARIGAGKYVEPGVCSQLVGGYSDLEGNLSAADVREVCQATVAAARVVSEYAEDHSMDELLELQHSLIEYWDYLGRDEEDDEYDPLPENFDPNAILLPEIREAMDRALADAGEFSATSPTQSGYSDTDPPSSSDPTGIPSADGPGESFEGIGSTCLFGLC